jgi:streptogramin lyase
MLVKIEGIMTAIDDPSQTPKPDEGRKFIQVSSGSEATPVVAVCNDGSVWSLDKKSMSWSRLPDAPQED